MKVKLLSRVRLLATPWTAAYQAPLSMGFARQEYWSGLPLPSPVIRGTSFYFYVLVVSLPGFGIRIMLATENEFGSVPFSCFWKSLGSIGVNSNINVW